jgi:protein required for attachment to host cells
MKAITTWVLVADGARAKPFLPDRPGQGLVEVPDTGLEVAHAPTRDINADRPGRTFDRGGEGRHAKEPPTDPHREAKRKFARQVAELLQDGLNRGAYDRLVLVAPPQALGDLRGQLGKAVQAKVSGELGKDLTHLPVHELPQHIGAVLAV